MAAALNLSRHPAAVLTSLPAPCAFADLDGVLAPCPALASSGPPGLDRRRVGRLDPEPPRIRHCGACPASGPVLSSVPTAVRTVPPASRPAREALYPVRVHGHSDVLDITLGQATAEWTVESNLYAQLQGSCTLGRDMGFQPGSHTNIAQFENTAINREDARNGHRSAERSI